jgi:hypothetical protein
VSVCRWQCVRVGVIAVATLTNAPPHTLVRHGAGAWLPPQALAEQSDLEALRQEKRAIQMEERRLKALLDIEKANAARAADRMAAARAEKQRKQAKVEFRREKVRHYLAALPHTQRLP